MNKLPVVCLVYNLVSEVKNWVLPNIERVARIIMDERKRIKEPNGIRSWKSNLQLKV